jgi:hypothetical protein
MDLSLEFGNGRITGEGTDDIGLFVITGWYNSNDGECHWTKCYVGLHDVFYKGIREGKGIWGAWEVDAASGGFKIWPVAYGESDDGAETEEKKQPVEAVGELVGAGTPGTFNGRIKNDRGPVRQSVNRIRAGKYP